MRKILPYIVVGIGIFLLLFGSLESMKREAILKSTIESGTYEIFPCNGTTLILRANGSLCIDLRKLNIRYLGRGTSIRENDVSFPLIRGSEGKLSLIIENYNASLNMTKEFVDGGYLIPVEEGNWNVTIRSEAPSVIYDIEEDAPRDANISRDGDFITVPCGDYSILLYNPLGYPVSVEAYRLKGWEALPIITLGLAASLLGVALGRQGHANRYQGEGSGKSSVGSPS